MRRRCVNVAGIERLPLPPVGRCGVPAPVPSHSPVPPTPVLASSELKDVPCTRGPGYWCQDLKTALQCGAVQHCFQTKWSEPKEAADLCEMCKNFVGEIATMVKDKAVQDAVKGALHKGCSLIPVKSFKDQCNEYVDAYLPLAFQFIENELKPKVVCSALRLCKSLQQFPKQEVLSNAIPEDEPNLANHPLSRLYPASQIPQQEGFSKDMPQCELCLFIVKELVSLLPEEKTESAIVHMLDEICSRLPESYSDECQAFVQKYGRKVIEMLFEEIAPHTVCLTLHLCYTKDAESSEQFYELLSGVSCTTCENTVRHLRLAQKNGTDVDALLVKGCSSLSGTQRFLCEDFVHSYKPQLSMMLQKSQEERDICVELDICIRKKNVPLLGENECTWGPSHWCKDLETATRCNAVEHCKQHIWN
ncbi:prosaposin-like isoform X2 [Pristis pectinata]|uniref:prosaposin-like isoform X2 n=1 Tax=Pristis pectinata TaxID=685728 RepID=UPI00223D4ECF|nr:prosaposin-like isoform X2 [Pristis pectinata]